MEHRGRQRSWEIRHLRRDHLCAVRRAPWRQAARQAPHTQGATTAGDVRVSSPPESVTESSGASAESWARRASRARAQEAARSEASVWVDSEEAWMAIPDTQKAHGTREVRSDAAWHGPGAFRSSVLPPGRSRQAPCREGEPTLSDLAGLIDPTRIRALKTWRSNADEGRTPRSPLWTNSSPRLRRSRTRGSHAGRSRTHRGRARRRARDGIGRGGPPGTRRGDARSSEQRRAT